MSCFYYANNSPDINAPNKTFFNRYAQIELSIDSEHGRRSGNGINSKRVQHSRRREHWRKL